VDENIKAVIALTDQITQTMSDEFRGCAKNINEGTQSGIGTTVMINVSVNLLEMLIADFAQQAGKDPLEVFNEIHTEIHKNINGYIAKYSQTGKSFMIDRRGQ
jgi:hypothetical protein